MTDCHVDPGLMRASDLARFYQALLQVPHGDPATALAAAADAYRIGTELGIAAMTVVAYYISWSKQQDVWKTLAPA